MNPKALLIPIAAFALSATSVSAYNSDLLQKAGLTNRQIQAFQTARNLQQEGEKNKARVVLEQAGINLQVMESVREAMRDHKEEMRAAIDRAVSQGDYQAFREAIQGSPLSDIVTSEAEFKLFSDAHAQRMEGNTEKTTGMMDERGAGAYL